MPKSTTLPGFISTETTAARPYINSSPRSQPEAFTPRKATPYFGYGYQFWLFPGEKRRFALLGVYGQSIFVDPELKLVMVITAAAKNVSVGNEPFAAERSAVWCGLVGKYGSW